MYSSFLWACVKPNLSSLPSWSQFPEFFTMGYSPTSSLPSVLKILGCVLNSFCLLLFASCWFSSVPAWVNHCHSPLRCSCPRWVLPTAAVPQEYLFPAVDHSQLQSLGGTPFLEAVSLQGYISILSSVSSAVSLSAVCLQLHVPKGISRWPSCPSWRQLFHEYVRAGV